jgi:hypothetical protein
MLGNSLKFMTIRGESSEMPECIIMRQYITKNGLELTWKRQEIGIDHIAHILRARLVDIQVA